MQFCGHFSQLSEKCLKLPFRTVLPVNNVFIDFLCYSQQLCCGTSQLIQHTNQITLYYFRFSQKSALVTLFVSMKISTCVDLPFLGVDTLHCLDRVHSETQVLMNMDCTDNKGAHWNYPFFAIQKGWRIAQGISRVAVASLYGRID